MSLSMKDVKHPFRQIVNRVDIFVLAEPNFRRLLLPATPFIPKRFQQFIKRRRFVRFQVAGDDGVRSHE